MDRFLKKSEKKKSKTKLGSTFSKWTKIKMSKIDFIQIIFFFPVFSKNKKLIFKKLLNRCTNGAKNMCWQKVNFLENF
jgi:maltose-binding protein MalE